MTNFLYIAGLVVIGATSYFVGKNKQKHESKSFTIKEDKNPVETFINTVEQVVDPSLFPITETIKIENRDSGQYNKLIGQMRFEGFQTLAFAVSGFNSNFDYITPIKSNPDQKFAIVLDEVQTNPKIVKKVQNELAAIDSTNVRLYTIEYQGV